MKPWFKLFLAGWIMGDAFDSLYQDALGKAGYIRLIDAAWISPVITVPVAIIIAGAAWSMVHSARIDLRC